MSYLKCDTVTKKIKVKGKPYNNLVAHVCTFYIGAFKHMFKSNYHKPVIIEVILINSI